jgi:N-methylhydantoinase A
VFMVEGAVEDERLNRELDELEAELRERLRGDGVPDAEIDVTRALDCRYVGQGYELRVTLPRDGFSPDALERFHELHRREYGHAFGDPIEIVNARVTAVGKRAGLGAPSVPAGSLDDALVGEGETVFRHDGELTAFQTRYYERSALPLDEPVAGPAVIFQRDATTVVPPAWTACSHRSGNLVLTR